MTREEIILKHIKRNGRGLEIAPGCAPIASKKQGFRVHFFDHRDRKALIEKYRPHGINVEPTSFRLMMRDLFELGFIQLKELAFHPPQGSEFYITLSPQGHLPGGARLELLG
jgi:hypothetical protein